MATTGRGACEESNAPEQLALHFVSD